MNPAIEKLEKEIAELEGQSEHFKFCESSGDESWRLTMKGCRKKADERLAEKRALKACVEALEKIAEPITGVVPSADAYIAMQALKEFNRAMGVSHE